MEKNLITRIIEFSSLCSSEDRELVEEMIHSAADYVKAVVTMETAAYNVLGLEGSHFREVRESTDRSRTIAHDDFITRVNVVNKLCAIYGVPPLYTGGAARRDYGSFALEIVSEIFINRR